MRKIVLVLVLLLVLLPVTACNNSSGNSTADADQNQKSSDGSKITNQISTKTPGTSGKSTDSSGKNSNGTTGVIIAKSNNPVSDAQKKQFFDEFTKELDDFRKSNNEEGKSEDQVRQDDIDYN